MHRVRIVLTENHYGQPKDHIFKYKYLSIFMKEKKRKPHQCLRKSLVNPV